MKKRPSKEEYYLSIAREVAKRGTCLRRNFGAVIVNNDQIVSTGYSGAPRGSPNCIDLARCPRDEMEIPRGERYELCRSVHAEMNAVIHAPRTEMVGSTLYLAGIEMPAGRPVENTVPCKLCARVIINAGIRAVVSMDGDRIVRHDVSEWVKKENAELPW